MVLQHERKLGKTIFLWKLIHHILKYFNIQACNEKPIDTDISGTVCCDLFELSELHDTINKTCGNSKEGHWIVKDWTSKNGRFREQEGYYKNNKKEGYWKFYKKDGTLKDSIEYKNNIPVTK